MAKQLLQLLLKRLGDIGRSIVVDAEEGDRALALGSNGGFAYGHRQWCVATTKLPKLTGKRVVAVVGSVQARAFTVQQLLEMLSIGERSGY
jgi:hypothetical protein